MHSLVVLLSLLLSSLSRYFAINSILVLIDRGVAKCLPYVTFFIELRIDRRMFLLRPCMSTSLKLFRYKNVLLPAFSNVPSSVPWGPLL